MGGSNDLSNLLTVTIEEHAELHRKLWEEHGKDYDYIAWKALSGQISSSEAILLAIKKSTDDRLKSGTHHLLTLSKQRVEKGTHHFLDSKFQSVQGKKGSKQAIQNGNHISLKPEVCSDLNKKRIGNGTHRFLDKELQKSLVERALREGTHSSQKIHICDKCGKIGKGGAMKRYHFENCKKVL